MYTKLIKFCPFILKIWSKTKLLNQSRVVTPLQRRSDSLNLELPTDMAEIKVAKKAIISPGKDS